MPSGAVKSFVQSALFDASHDVFVGVVVTAVALFAVLWLMPRRTEMLDVSWTLLGVDHVKHAGGHSARLHTC